MDQQSTVFLFLSWPLSGKRGNFVDLNFFYSLWYELFFSLKKSLHLRLFINNKSTEMFPPLLLKVAVSWDFCHFFISLIQPIWAPDKHVKWFILKICFHGDICEISDSARANTARSQTLRRLTKPRVRLCAG